MLKNAHFGKLETVTSQNQTLVRNLPHEIKHTNLYSAASVFIGQHFALDKS